MEGQGKIVNQYLADGTLLRRSFFDEDDNELKRIDYQGEFLFVNGKLDKIFTEEGYYMPATAMSQAKNSPPSGGVGGGKVKKSDYGTYFYTLKDHLGHTRVVVDEEENVIQETAYYPYGGVIADLSTKTKYNYLYTGKEFIDSLGVNWYDHHARYYDPEVGRWFAIDPALQAASPYMAMGNNPMIYVDENGEFWHIVIGAVVGGVINLGVKLWQGKIDSFGAGLMAFGIGAVAGAVAAATGGPAFLAAGGGAAGAGGFVAGAAAGAAASMPIQNRLNHLAFGDPLMTPQQYAQGIAFAALLSGVTNGGIALANGRSFWNGTLNSAPQSIVPVASLEAKVLKPNEIKTPMQKPQSLPQTRGDNLPEPATFRKIDLPGERTYWVRNGIEKGNTNIAKIPVGRRGNVMSSVAKNSPRTINGTKFTGHALDQMQSRGIISPRAVLDVVRNPANTFSGNIPGTQVFIRDNLKVVTNIKGDIITVIWQ